VIIRNNYETIMAGKENTIDETINIVLYFITNCKRSSEFKQAVAIKCHCGCD